jgi:hypothetical protein
MNRTRRYLLRQLASAAVVPFITVALPPSGHAASTANTQDQSGGRQPARFTRARDYNPAKIVAEPLELVSRRLVLPFDKRFVRGKYSPSRMVYKFGVWPGYNDFSGDEEAALINNASGEWLCGGNPHNMLVWAEGHAALPHHWINPKTLRLWSIEETPRVNTYFRAPTFDGSSDSPVKEMDTAHYQSICFVPYLATRDPFYLEELQFAANYHILALNPDYRMNAAKTVDLGLFHPHQMRGWVWQLRDTIAAFLATPEGDVPAPLLPKSYWKRILDNNRDWVLANWVRKSHSMSNLHMFPIFGGDPTTISPWQQDWVGATLGWMIWTGQFDDWRPIYDWQIRQAIDRSSGLSGYPRSQAVFYWYKTTGVVDMENLAAVNLLRETPNGKFPPQTNMHYAASLRANLKIASINGVVGAAECLAYIDPQVDYIEPKWAI